jgi:hypothetical protein
MRRWIFAAAAAAAGAAAPGAAQAPAELARFEAALDAGRHDEAARIYDGLVDTRRLRAGVALAPDPLLSGMAGRLYLRRGHNVYALAYLEQAQHASVPAGQRRAAAIALAEAQTRTGDRRSALAGLQRLDRAGMSAEEAAAAALAEARALLADDPRAALARVEPVRAATAEGAAFEAETLAAQAHSLLGDRASAAAAADRAWTLSAPLPAHRIAPLRIASVRAALAAERGDHAAAAAMLNVAGAGTSGTRLGRIAVDTLLRRRRPDTGRPRHVRGPRRRRGRHRGRAGRGQPPDRGRPLPRSAGRGGSPCANRRSPASGTVLTLRCRSVPNADFPAEIDELPFARWFAARGLYSVFGLRSAEALALKIGEAEQRLGDNHPGLIPLRLQLGDWLAMADAERGEESSFEVQALREAVTGAMRRIGGADEAIGPPALEQLFRQGSYAPNYEEAVRRYRAGAPAVLDALTLDRGYVFLVDWFGWDRDLPGDVKRRAIERLAARFPARSADPRLRALRMRLGALLREEGDAAAAARAYAASGTPPGACVLQEEAPTATEGSIGSDDFPPLPLEHGIGGFTVIEYGVGTDGRVTAPRVIFSARRFFSDNAAAACPEVMAAIAAANRLDTAYDGDALSRGWTALFPSCSSGRWTALWVATGTAANSLALAALCPPHGSIVCHRDAHIQNDECGAPEFYTHGAKLLLAEGEGAKLTPESVTALLATGAQRRPPGAAARALDHQRDRIWPGLHADETAALGELCRARGLGFHMDGARFANAVARLGCSPADLTWRAGSTR